MTHAISPSSPPVAGRSDPCRRTDRRARRAAGDRAALPRNVQRLGDAANRAVSRSHADARARPESTRARRRWRRWTESLAAVFASLTARDSPPTRLRRAAQPRHALPRPGAHGGGAGRRHTAVAGRTLSEAFHERHRRQYTFALEDTAVEIVNIRVTATARVSRPVIGLPGGDEGDPRKVTRMVHFADGDGHAGAAPIAAAVYDRGRMPIGFQATGPLIVEEPSTTTVVHPGQRLAVDTLGNLVITATGS